MRLLTLSLTALLLCAAAGLLSACEYYRVDPKTGKRYEISQERYKQGMEHGEDSDSSTW